MRQSGTIALALILAWLLVVAETAPEHSGWAAEPAPTGQVDAWAVGVIQRAGSELPDLRLEPSLGCADYCAGIGVRRSLRGISLLI